MSTRKPEVQKRLREPTVVASAVRFLGCEGYKVRNEVPHLGQSVDIAATKGRWLTFVEAKVDQWRRALEQCRNHELSADFICIALAIRNVPSELNRQLAERGYGLLLYDRQMDACRWAIKPKKNRNIWNPQRRRVAQFMRTIGLEQTQEL